MIKHYFFGKECLINRALNDYQDLNKNLIQRGFSVLSPVIFMNQVHSSDVFLIDSPSKIPDPSNRPKADAIVTNLPNLIIGLFTADCTPILFVDPKNSVIGAAHSGWAGSMKNIAAKTIDKMITIGANINQIQAFIGPTIRQKSYEISQEFYQRFVDEDSANRIFFIAGDKAGHYWFDLPGYVADQLHKAGIEKITDEQIDTYSNPDKFFSYRRSTHLNQIDCGRNVSVIAITKSHHN